MGIFQFPKGFQCAAKIEKSGQEQEFPDLQHCNHLGTC